MDKDDNRTVSKNMRKKFEQYLCFYYASMITSGDHLKKHVDECHGLHQPKPSPPFISSKCLSFPVGFPPPTFPSTALGVSISKCEICGWYASSRIDMVNHKESIHNYKI